MYFILLGLSPPTCMDVNLLPCSPTVATYVRARDSPGNADMATAAW